MSLEMEELIEATKQNSFREAKLTYLESPESALRK